MVKQPSATQSLIFGGNYMKWYINLGCVFVGKKVSFSCPRTKVEYLALIIFAEKNVKQTSATDPKFEYLSLIILAGKNGKIRQVAVGDPKFEFWGEFKIKMYISYGCVFGSNVWP